MTTGALAVTVTLGGVIFTEALPDVALWVECVVVVWVVVVTVVETAGLWVLTTTGLLEEAVVNLTTVDFLGLRVATAAEFTLTETVDLLLALFLLGFGATLDPRNFPFAPLTQSAGLAKVLRRYLRL